MGVWTRIDCRAPGARALTLVPDDGFAGVDDEDAGVTERLASALRSVQWIRRTDAETRVIWRAADAVSPPLYPVGIAEIAAREAAAAARS